MNQLCTELPATEAIPGQSSASVNISMGVLGIKLSDTALALQMWGAGLNIQHSRNFPSESLVRVYWKQSEQLLLEVPVYYFIKNYFNFALNTNEVLFCFSCGAVNKIWGKSVKTKKFKTFLNEWLLC